MSKESEECNHYEFEFEGCLSCELDISDCMNDLQDKLDAANKRIGEIEETIRLFNKSDKRFKLVVTEENQKLKEALREAVVLINLPVFTPEHEDFLEKYQELLK